MINVDIAQETSATETDAEIVVIQEYVEPKFYTRIPNIVYHLGLSPYAITLYNVLKQTAGDRGLSFKSTKTLAKQCNMSAGMVSGCKGVLGQAFPQLNGKPLIRIEEKERPGGGKPYHEITIVNIWPENVAYFEDAHPIRGTSSRGERNKITLEEKPTEEREPSPFSEELRGKDFLEIAALAANGNGREEVEPGAMIAEHVAAIIGIETPPEWKYRENWLEPSLAIWKEARTVGLDVGQVRSALNSIFLENPWMAEKVKTPNGFFNSFREYVHEHRAAASLAQVREVERAANAARVQASLVAAGLV